MGYQGARRSVGPAAWPLHRRHRHKALRLLRADAPQRQASLPLQVVVAIGKQCRCIMESVPAVVEAMAGSDHAKVVGALAWLCRCGNAARNAPCMPAGRKLPG